jgi:hypothetical protein
MLPLAGSPRIGSIILIMRISDVQSFDFKITLWERVQLSQNGAKPKSNIGVSVWRKSGSQEAGTSAINIGKAGLSAFLDNFRARICQRVAWAPLVFGRV